MKKLRAKRQIFASEYVIDLNGTRAAIAAGYSRRRAAQQAARLLTNGKVLEEIRERIATKLQKSGITTEFVVRELALLALSNMMNYIAIDIDGGVKFDLSRLTRETAAAICEIVIEEPTERVCEQTGRSIMRRVRIKLPDKRSALEALGQYLNISGSVGMGIRQ